MENDWISNIRVGDILAVGDSYRVVRDVKHSKSERHPPKTYVTFTIKRCSWTGRCYTVLTRSDLKTRGFRATGHSMRLRRQIDAKIRKAIVGRELPKDGPYSMTCCDVEGIG